MPPSAAPESTGGPASGASGCDPVGHAGVSAGFDLVQKAPCTVVFSAILLYRDSGAAVQLSPTTKVDLKGGEQRCGGRVREAIVDNGKVFGDGGL